MVNFRMLSEVEFKTSKSDYAQSLRTIYGDDGYQKYSAKINSIIEEGREKTKKATPDNPLKESLEARIAYLEAEYARVKKINIKNKLEHRNFLAKLGGMLKITQLDEDNLALKELASFNSEVEESAVLSSLQEAYHSQAIHGFNQLT